MLVAKTQRDGVVTLTLCRAAKRNALSVDLIDSLGAMLDAARDDDVAVLVLRGDGDRAFASGGDLKELAAIRTIEDAADMSRRFRAVLEKLRGFPVPVIAALNGDAFGGGAELAMACDLRIATGHARIGFLQGKLAISTAWGGGPDLFAALGISRALRLLGRAEILPARRALDWGLLDAVADDGQPFDTFVDAYVAGFAERTPDVMRAFKALAYAARTATPRDATLALETEHFARTWADDAHWAAVEASLGRAGKN